MNVAGWFLFVVNLGPPFFVFVDGTKGTEREVSCSIGAVVSEYYFSKILGRGLVLWGREIFTLTN